MTASKCKLGMPWKFVSTIGHSANDSKLGVRFKLMKTRPKFSKLF